MLPREIFEKAMKNLIQAHEEGYINDTQFHHNRVSLMLRAGIPFQKEDTDKEFTTFKGVSPEDPRYWEKTNRAIREGKERYEEPNRTTDEEFTTFEGVSPEDPDYWRKTDRLIAEKLQKRKR